MLLSTMNYNEMYRELIADHENVTRWMERQRRRMMDVARRCKELPKHLIWKYKSPRKNDWYIDVMLTNRNPDKGHLISECVLRRADDGWWMHHVMVNKYCSVQCILTPHCLKRYAERTGREGMKIEELVSEWLICNHDVMGDDDQSLSGKKSRGGDNEQRHYCTTEGVLMGDAIRDPKTGIAKTFVAKTFITYDMATARQVVVFGKNKEKLFTTENLQQSVREYEKRTYKKWI